MVPTNNPAIEGTSKVLAVVADLMFVVKISDAAKRAGMQVQFVKDEGVALEQASLRPQLIIIDLNIGGLDPVELIRKLGSSDEVSAPKIGFVSHVDVHRRQQALDAGCDIVMPRSAFSQNLPQLLAQYKPE